MPEFDRGEMLREKQNYQSLISLVPFSDDNWEGHISVSLGDPHAGWILLWVSVTVFNQAVTIHTSEAYDPYPDIVQWLEKIVSGDLPCFVEIEEEGMSKTLRAVSTDHNMLDFQIYRGYGGILDNTFAKNRLT